MDDTSGPCASQAGTSLDSNSQGPISQRDITNHWWSKGTPVLKPAKESDIQKKREHRARISESQGEKHHLYGKRLNPQHRAKIAQSNMGRSLSKESRTKISDTLKGHEVSNTIRAKLHLSNENNAKNHLTDQLRIIDAFEATWA